ncbi:MAG: enoyl-CoA hydratase/isomerase family protein [Acidimicrobiaceae bacterium]|nr:enoyl-CoA hydratase/isomerase family protein [Acidimicrobiaceae bacterium]
MNTAYQTIVVDIDAGVAVVTLNRPQQLNAFTPTMGRELGHAFVNLEADEAVRAVVVTGAGRAFCSGAALDPAGSTFRGSDGDGLGPPLSELSPWTMATPVIAAINGAAIGLGITYPMQWDIRVAAEEAKIGFAFTRRGLLPEANSLWLLSRLVGASRALDLLLTGRTITGAAAAEMGLASQAVPAARVLDTALDIARDIAVNTAPASVALTKRLFYDQLGWRDRQAARADERAAFAWLASQPDAREGISAFLERRPPAWGMSKHTSMPGLE